VQGDPVKLPPAVPPLVKATVPPGAVGVPDPTSLTKAEQVVTCETTTDDGVHVTAVVVGLPPTVTVLLVLGPLPR